ncbi:GtrA family protein [Pseudomonas putida]|nr:GtrA family protein [Pseudomonas putida]
MRDWFVTIVKSDAARPLRFILVGGIATIVHMSFATVALALVADLSPFLANLIAFAVAFLVSFYGHRHLTFLTRGNIRRFLVVAVAGFALNNLILYAILVLGVPKLISIIIATACVPVMSYLVSSLWAFKK